MKGGEKTKKLGIIQVLLHTFNAKFQNTVTTSTTLQWGAPSRGV